MKKPIELNIVDWFCIRYLRKDKAKAKAIIKEALGDVHIHKNPRRKEQEAANGING